MFKSVDEESKEALEGFSYTSKMGCKEYVKLLDYNEIEIEDENDGACVIYMEDIPKLIKALQAAYDYKQEK